jgi:glycerol-3-phosphate dehydrogenase (NAD(P)+)
MAIFNQVGVIGAGSWGTALAVLLAESGRSVGLWSHSEAVVETIQNKGENTTYLPGIPIPKGVRVTKNLNDAVLGAGLVLIVTPSRALREVAGKIAVLDPDPATVWVSCTKGIEHDSGMLMSSVLEEVLQTNQVGVLSGPNHAIEVARKIPAAAVVGSSDSEVCQQLQQTFNLSSFRVYSSDDVVGIQLGGALKNVFAIAAGCSDGFSMGDNAKAGLVTRALAEMTRLGCALGGRKETFSGLSGIGDLMVTCFSKHSRNRKVGERLGRGESLTEIQQSMQMVAEGIPTALSAWQCARRLGIEAPITEQVHAVLYGTTSPREGLERLLGRSPKPESDEDRKERVPA